MLGGSGCRFPFERRPLGCRELVPNVSDPGVCTGVTFDKKRAGDEWMPYADLLSSLVSNPPDRERRW